MDSDKPFYETVLEDDCFNGSKRIHQDYKITFLIQDVLRDLNFPQYFSEVFKIFKTKKFIGRFSQTVKIKAIIYHLLRGFISLNSLEQIKSEKTKILSLILRNFSFQNTKSTNTKRIQDKEKNISYQTRNENNLKQKHSQTVSKKTTIAKKDLRFI